MKELRKEDLLKWGISITEDPNEPSGYLILRYGMYCHNSKDVLKKITPQLNTKYHPKSGKYKSYYLVGFSVKGKVVVYPLARIIYAWYKGVCPKDKDIDHINNDSLDNRIENLQPLTRRENLAKREGNTNQYGRMKKERIYKELPNYVLQKIKNGTYTEEE